MESGHGSGRERQQILGFTEEDDGLDPRASEMGEQDPQNTKFTLPMEPTESLDRNRDYPPIVTADGWVDTDIDHLMEHPEDDFDEVSIQDIPSKFPKPKVIRVIDGSLDDDIDNLMNHDGTMAHTLVDAPKHFNRSDLKEINSKNSDKKHNARSQSNRSFKIMNQEMSDEDISVGSAELVPYSERNNSSNGMMEPVFGQGKVSQPPTDDTPEINNAPSPEAQDSQDSGKEATESGDLAENETCHNKLNIVMGGAETAASDGDVQKPESDTISGEKENENKDNEEKSLESNILDVLSNVDCTDTVDDVSKLMQQLLSRMSVQEIQKRLDAETDNDLKSTSQLKEALEGGTVKTNEDSRVCNDETVSSVADTCVALKTEVEEIEKMKPVVAASNPNPPVQTKQSEGSESPMQESMALLKLTLENIVKDSKESDLTDSQRMLAVTALKVAGESMTAAAKMADALTLLVKTSHHTSNSSVSTGVESTEPSPLNTVPCKDDSISKNYHERLGMNTVSRSDGNVYRSSAISVDQRDQREAYDKTRRPVNEKARKPREASPDMVKADAGSEVQEKLLCIKTKNETEDDKIRTKIMYSTDDDAVDPGEKKSCDHKEANRKRNEQLEDTSRTVREKMRHRRPRSGARELESSKEERSKRLARKQEDNHYKEGENGMEKHDDVSPGQRRRERENKKKYHESDYRKKAAKKGEEVDEYEDPHGEWVKYEAVKDRATRYQKEIMERHEKQMNPFTESKKRSLGAEHEYLNIDKHQRHKSQRDRIFRKGMQHKAQGNQRVGKTDMPGGFEAREEDMSSNTRRAEKDDLGKSDPWSLTAPAEPIWDQRYFDHVARRLRDISLTRDGGLSHQKSNPEKEYIRAKLVGSCVDPFTRDSDYDSIEFNGNARESSSRIVRFEEETDSRTDEGF